VESKAHVEFSKRIGNDYSDLPNKSPLVIGVTNHENKIPVKKCIVINDQNDYEEIKTHQYEAVGSAEGGKACRENICAEPGLALLATVINGKTGNPDTSGEDQYDGYSTIN